MSIPGAIHYGGKMSDLTFREIEIEDRDKVNDCLEKSGFMSSEYSFPNLFIWRRRFGYRIALHAGFLFIMVQDGNDSYYFYPAGEGDIGEAIKAISADSASKGSRGYITSATRENTLLLESIFPGRFRFAAHRDYSDYIYNADDLINLPGRKYHSKRNHISRFIEEYGQIVYQDIDSGNLEECRSAYGQWLEEKKDKGEDPKSFSDEATAMEECFSHYRSIGMKGGLIRARGRLCSFSFGSRINSETFGIHIEKSLIECQGGYATINREFAARHAADFRYINREEDLGIKGLRRAKLSYHPVMLLEKYTAPLEGANP